MGTGSYGAWQSQAGSFRARPFLRADLPACTRLLHFEWRGEGVSQSWDRALLILFREEAVYGAIIEDLAGTRPAAVACGLGLFISTNLLTRLAQCPRASLDRTLADSALNDREAILCPREIGRGNAGAGLNLLAPVAFDERVRRTGNTYPVWQALAHLGVLMHAGYRLAWMLSRVSRGEDLRVHLVTTGGRILSPVEEPIEWLTAQDRLEAPVIVACTRDDAIRHPGTYASMFFFYTPPRFHFTPPEQAMLQLAVAGMQDGEIARELHVSPSTVKKRWESVYDRITEVDAGLLSDAPEPDRAHSSRAGQSMAGVPPAPWRLEQESLPRRGPGKRHRLILYLTGHMEELRPFCA